MPSFSAIMKKAIPLAVLLLLAFHAQAFAIFCSKCGIEAKDDAAFCSKCGTKLSHSPNSANEPGPSADTLLKVAQELETYLKTSNFITCVAKFPEFKIAFESGQKSIDVSSLDDSGKKKVDLATKKFALLQLLMEMWRIKVHGPMRVKAEAGMIKLFFALERFNEMITAIEGGKPASAAAEMEKALENRMKDCTITSKYLKIGPIMVAKGEPIWVMEEEPTRVKVIHMSEPNLAIPSPVTGWVTIEEMKNRTTWAPPK